MDVLLDPRVIQWQQTVFCCLFTLPYLFFLGWLLADRKSALGAFCLTGLMVLFPMAISLLPPAPYLAVVLLFWAVLLLFSSSLGKRHRLMEDRGRFFAAGNSAARPAMLLLFLFGAALCMGATYLVFPQETYKRPQVVADLRDGFWQGFGLNAVLQGGVGNGNGRVNLSSLGERNYTGETALRVRYQWNEPPAQRTVRKDYLKSFVGSVYTGHSWEKLDQEDRRQLAQILETLQPQTMADQLYTAFLEEENSPVRYTLEVENLAANPRCVYAPYGLNSSNVDGNLLRCVEDGFVESGRMFSGTPTYTLEAISLDTYYSYATLLQNAVLLGYLEAHGLTRDLGNQSNKYAIYEDRDFRNVLTMLTQGFLDENGEMLSYQTMDLWSPPQELDAYLSPQQLELSQQLEAYNQFVYQHYTQLPEGLESVLQQYLEENHLHDDSPILLAQKIATTLAAQCSYTLSPPALPKGKDFVEFFLQESHQGFCVHFATAAVALLRASGVPARYAEGYAVPAGEEGWVDVPDYNAHAWVEIYFGGTGWVPVEVTPAGPDAPAVFQNAQLPSPEAATPTPTPTPSPTPSPSPTPEASSPSPSVSTSPSPSAVPAPQEAASGQGGGPRHLGWILTGSLVGTGALLLGCFVLRRRALLTLRKRRFSQRDKNKAALELYAQVLRLYREGNRLLPNWKGEPSPQLEQIALKARFSQHILTPKELLPLFKDLQTVEHQLRDHLTLPQRLWCQYGLVLF